MEILDEINVYRHPKQGYDKGNLVASVDGSDEPTPMTSPVRIEICGGIATGKTTFANLFGGTGKN